MPRRGCVGANLSQELGWEPGVETQERQRGGTSAPPARTGRAVGRRNPKVGIRGVPWGELPRVRAAVAQGDGCRAQSSVSQLRSGTPYQKVPEMKGDPGGGG